MKKKLTALLLILALLVQVMALASDFNPADLQNLQSGTTQTLGNDPADHGGSQDALPDLTLTLPDSEPTAEPEPVPEPEPTAEPAPQPEKREIPITKINIVAVPKEGVKLGETLDIGNLVRVEPYDASAAGLTYKVSDENIAGIDEKGVLTGRSTGKVTVTVTDPKTRKSAKVTIQVITPVEEVHVSSTSVTVNVGKKIKITADVLPSYATNKKLTWYSKDERIAKVNNGTIVGVNPGSTFVHCMSTDGSYKGAAIMVTVTKPVKKITFGGKSVTVNVGREVGISMNVEPFDATDKSVEWTSSNPSVATVDYKGNVKGKNAGVCIVTVSTKDGSNLSKNITVYVEPKDPVDIDHLWWGVNGYGIKNGEIKVDIVNLGVNRKVKGINFTVNCYNSAGTLTGTTFQVAIFRGGVKPGMRKTSQWCGLKCKGLDNATAKLEILLTGVTFDDGSMMTYHYGEEPKTTFELR